MRNNPGATGPRAWFSCLVFHREQSVSWAELTFNRTFNTGLSQLTLSWNSTREIGHIGRHLADKPDVKVTMCFGPMPPDASDFPGGSPALAHDGKLNTNMGPWVDVGFFLFSARFSLRVRGSGVSGVPPRPPSPPPTPSPQPPVQYAWLPLLSCLLGLRLWLWQCPS